MADAPKYPIGFVSMVTGLSAHLLRAWERRYGAVKPSRTASGHRLYTQADIDRLTHLQKLVSGGHGISRIAALDQDALNALKPKKGDWPPPQHAGAADRSPDPPQEIISACLQAIEAMDCAELNRSLQKASMLFSRMAMIDDVIKPLMEEVGERWSRGRFRILHERLASQAIHAHLCRMQRYTADGREDKPRLLVATPVGQHCGLGALAVTLVAQDHGWETVYLGPDLPSEEIAAACTRLDARMIALSITCRINDTVVKNELQDLTDLIDSRCPIIVGGQACQRYRLPIEASGAKLCTATEAFVALLK